MLPILLSLFSRAPGWLCLMAFMRRVAGPVSPTIPPLRPCGTPIPIPGFFGRTASTGNTLRRFFGNLARACETEA